MSPDEAMTPTGAKQWKKSRSLEPVEVPSGNMAIIRRKPLEVFLKAGLIPNDLLPIIKDAVQNNKKNLKPEDIMKDDKSVIGVLELIDVVVVECMVEPKVLPVPELESMRDEQQLYVDEVDWNDKQFVYSYAVGAVSDLEAFRQQQEGAVEIVPDGDLVAGEAVKSGSDS